MNTRFFITLTALVSLVLLGSCKGKEPNPKENGGYSIKLYLNSEESYAHSAKLGDPAIRLEAALQQNNKNVDREVSFTWEVSDTHKALLSPSGDGDNVLYVEALDQGDVSIVCKATVDGKEISSKPFVLTINDDPSIESLIFKVDAAPGTKYTIRLASKSGSVRIYHGDNKIEDKEVSTDSQKNEPTPVQIEVGESRTIRIVSPRFFQAWIEDVPVTDIDVTHAPNMLYLYVIGGKLKEFDASPLPLIKELTLNDNDLQKISFGPKNLDLLFVELDDNELNENTFNMPNEIAKNIRALYLSRNNFTTFDLKKFPEMREFKMSANKLSGSFSAKGLEWLWKLYVAENELTSIDLTGADAMSFIRVQDNKLTDITVNDFSYWQQVMLQNNNFPAGYLDKLCEQLPSYDYHNPDGTIDSQKKGWADNTIFRAWGNPNPPSNASYDALEKKCWKVERKSPQSTTFRMMEEPEGNCDYAIHRSATLNETPDALKYKSQN